MDGIPGKCPTCSTAIPEGAVRCPGCGRVFGEDNRCPHCHAIAAVRPAGSGYACLACGKPRERLPGTTVLGEPDARSSLVPTAPVADPATGGLGTAGGVVGLAGLVLALTSMAVFGVGPLSIAMAVAAAAIGLGLASAGRARVRAAEEQRFQALDKRIRALAAKSEGDLTVDDVAAALRIPTALADATLTRMSDGSTITAEVDESVGKLHFVFHDLKPAPPPKTRVELAESEGEGEGEGEKASPKKLSR